MNHAIAGVRSRYDRSHLRDLLISLETALSGLEAASEDGCRPHPGAAAALGPGSHRRTVDVAPGLWAILRTSPDGRNQMLCVHNPGDDPVEFTPDEYLDAAGTLSFVRGSMTSGGTQSSVTCRLGGQQFVWLGRFAEPAAS